MVFFYTVNNLRDFTLAVDERGYLGGEVVRDHVQGAQRREVGRQVWGHQLEDAFRVEDVLEAAQPQVALEENEFDQLVAEAIELLQRIDLDAPRRCWE